MILVCGYVDTLAEFLGKCFGVILTERREDGHVCFSIVVEDDGNWFYSKSPESSSFWLTELHEQLGRAIEWCKEYADPNIYDGKQIGWKVRVLTNR